MKILAFGHDYVKYSSARRLNQEELTKGVEGIFSKKYT